MSSIGLGRGGFGSAAFFVNLTSSALTTSNSLDMSGISPFSISSNSSLFALVSAAQTLHISSSSESLEKLQYFEENSRN